MPQHQSKYSYILGCTIPVWAFCPLGHDDLLPPWPFRVTSILSTLDLLFSVDHDLDHPILVGNILQYFFFLLNLIGDKLPEILCVWICYILALHLFLSLTTTRILNWKFFYIRDLKKIFNFLNVLEQYDFDIRCFACELFLCVSLSLIVFVLTLESCQIF